MYSHELDNIIKSSNNKLTKQDYAIVADINKNPQINHIKYNPCDDSTLIETKDNYKWVVFVA